MPRRSRLNLYYEIKWDKKAPPGLADLDVVGPRRGEVVALRDELVGVLGRVLDRIQDPDLDQTLFGRGPFGARIPGEVVAPQVRQHVQAAQAVRVVEERDAVAHRIQAIRILHPVFGGREQAAREHLHEVAHLNHQLVGRDVELEPVSRLGAHHESLAPAHETGQEVHVGVLGGTQRAGREAVPTQREIAQETDDVVTAARVAHQPLRFHAEERRDGAENDIDPRAQLGVHALPGVVEARPVGRQVREQITLFAEGRTLLPELLEIGCFGRLIPSVLRARRGVAPLTPVLGHLVALLDDERLGVETVQVPLQEREQLGVDAVLIEYGQAVLAQVVEQPGVSLAVVAIDQGREIVDEGGGSGHEVLQKERVARTD